MSENIAARQWKEAFARQSDDIVRLTRELAEAREALRRSITEENRLRQELAEARAERDKWHGEWVLSRQRECDIGEIERELDTTRQALAAAREERDEARRHLDYLLEQLGEKLSSWPGIKEHIAKLRDDLRAPDGSQSQVLPHPPK